MQNRYLSLDVFRGLTIALMIIVNTPGSWSYVYAPLDHAKWHGCTPTDWVFPSFMFAIGLSMFFSFKSTNYQLTQALGLKILKRSFLIFMIGFLIHLFPFTNIHWEKVRYLGVLQRIGIGYGLAALIVLTLPRKKITYVIAALLLGYWAIMYFWGEPAAPYEMYNNAVYQLDKYLLGEQHLWHGENPPFDPEGLLSTLPSVATILLGYLVAAYVQQKNDKTEMIKNVIIFGVAAITISEIWNFSFPINKKLWTSSYVLQMAGIDCLILAIAIWAIDLMGWNRNTKFFEVFGANAIAAYIISEVPIILLLKNKTQMLLADGTSKTISYYGWIFRSWFEPTFGSYFGSFMFAFIWMLICWCILYAMYQRKIFLKL